MKKTKMKKINNAGDATEAHADGYALFYLNNSTERAELRPFNGSWGFQYSYETPAGRAYGSIKFVRPTAREAIKAFFAGRNNRYLYAEVPKANNDLVFQTKDVDDEDFGITIKVPKGTKVTIIEV